MKLRTPLAAISAAALAAAGIALVGPAANAAEAPIINEFVADNAGADWHEYVEILAPVGYDTSDYSVALVEGDANARQGQVLSVRAVGPNTADGRIVLSYPANGIQNNSLSILLVTGTVAVGDQIDANNDGVIDDTVAFTVVDGVGVLESPTTAPDALAWGTVLRPDFDGGTYTVGGASRIPDGVRTGSASDWMRNDFSGAGLVRDGVPVPGQPARGIALNTPGAANAESTATEPTPTDPAPSDPAPSEPQTCGSDATLISAVQGDGDTSPMAGQRVTVEAVVVGDFQQGGFNGYYVQEEDADADANPATSEALFVFARDGAEVQQGDLVRVSGLVSEFASTGGTQTQITAQTVLACGTAALPTATEVALPLTDPESIESMLVTFADPLRVLETYRYGRYGEIVLGPERQFQPTALYEPGSQDARDLAASNASHRITLDDGRSVQNPDPAIHPGGGTFAQGNAFRSGDTFTNVTGVFDWRFGTWRIQPTAAAEHTASNPRPDVPAVGGELQVAAFNVLNYFTTLNERGANTEEEFERQQTKIVASIIAMDAEVVGLLEIENNADVALNNLVDALNDAAGEVRYAAIETGKLGTDIITTALIYQPQAVTPAGAFAILDESVDPRFDTSRNRPALAQTFRDAATGEEFTVAINHLKSKSSACGAADPMDANGQGNCNLTRLAAAQALADWLATNPTDSASDATVIIGDLNSYGEEDPIRALADAGFVDLQREYQGDVAYSYAFDGQLGALDYALGNAAFNEHVTGAAAWHANSDESPLFDYNVEYKSPTQVADLFAPDAYRASDHDAILVGVSFGDAPQAAAEVVSEAETRPGSGEYATEVATVAGSELLLRLNASNTGNVPIGSVVVTNAAYVPTADAAAECAALPNGFEVGTLAPGAEVSLVCPMVVQTSFESTVTFAGTVGDTGTGVLAAAAGDTVTRTATAVVTVTDDAVTPTPPAPSPTQPPGDQTTPTAGSAGTSLPNTGGVIAPWLLVLAAIALLLGVPVLRRRAS